MILTSQLHLEDKDTALLRVILLKVMLSREAYEKAERAEISLEFTEALDSLVQKAFELGKGLPRHHNLKKPILTEVLEFPVLTEAQG